MLPLRRGETVLWVAMDGVVGDEGSMNGDNCNEFGCFSSALPAYSLIIRIREELVSCIRHEFG
jgi:hypothetical protein